MLLLLHFSLANDYIACCAWLAPTKTETNLSLEKKKKRERMVKKEYLYKKKWRGLPAGPMIEIHLTHPVGG